MHTCVLYGIIDIGPSSEGIDPELDDNYHIINNIEPDGEWPPITRSMFSFTGAECLHRGQLIHFAASYKNLEWGWDLWLEKFENLLRQLHWIGVTLQLQSELCGDLTYQWLASNESLQGNGQPTTNWEFSGGPRKLILDPDR